jgi:hypothetical protein
MSEDGLGQDGWLSVVREALQEWSHVPPEVLQAGYAAFTWRTIDAELAELTYDSIAQDSQMVTSRSQHAALRALSLSSSSLTIELEIEPTLLMGQLVPPGPADMVLTLHDGTKTFVQVDDLGCFTIEPVPEAAFRLQVVGEQSVVTDWIRL